MALNPQWQLLRIRYLLASTFALFTVSAPAQTGGPIGGPIGAPTGAHGANGSYSQGSRGALSAPSTNWSSGRQAGKGSFSSDRRNQSHNLQRNYYTPPPVTNIQQVPRQARPSASVQQNRRQQQQQATTVIRRQQNQYGKEEKINLQPLTRKVARTESNSLDHYRDLVQKGMLSEAGFGNTPDYKRAHSLYCEAARGGYPDAMVRLGWIYADGKGVTKNPDIAATLFERATRFGSDIGRELSERYKVSKEVLPTCLKGSVVEKGTPERAATATELAALSQHTAGSKNPVVGAARAKIVQHVFKEARKYKLDPRLVLAVMSTESAFNPNARSERNAFGLMQLIPETAERFGVVDVLDPVQNIRGGMAYLRWLLNYYRGDVSLVLAAYNAGEGAVDRHNGVPPFAETVAYVQRIRAAYPFDHHPYDPSAGNTRSAVVKKNEALSGLPAPAGAGGV
ncbi:MAG: transglycosylase SLT domain-containing protein [Lautropia sp.]|nr:transglycosylase SLT domain-containing protein [Lautropia sp.]